MTDARIPVPPNSRIFILRLLSLHFVADPIYTLYLKAYCMYSLKEAKNAVQDWIDELGTMDWPADWALPNWHRDNRRCRLPCPQNHRPFSGPMRATDLPSDWTWMMVNAESSGVTEGWY